jgi:hypothetical protein
MTTTENRHPVDSTYHPCCNAIGRHGRDCKTEVPLPAGADFGDNWETTDGSSHTRVVSTPNRYVTDSELLIWADAVQGQDGRISDPAARIDISSLEQLNGDQARELASHLLELAALLDTWTAGVTR